MKKSILAVALVAVMAFTALVLGIVAVAQRPLQGEQGTPGIQGEQGIQGNPGAQGNPGTAGNDGGDGTNGTNGTDGERGARMTVGVAFPIDVILGDSFLNTTTWNLYEVAGLNPTAWTFRGNLFGQTQSGQALMQAEVIAINALIDALQHINGIANLRNAINAIDTRINDWTGYPLIGVNHTELDAQRARLSILEGSALAPVEDILEALRQQLLNATAGMTQQDLADLMVSGIVPVVNLIPDVLVEGMVRALVMEALPADLRNTIMNQVTVNLSEMFGLPGNVIISLTPGGQTTIPFLGTWQHDDIFDVMLGMAGLIDMSALIPAMMPDVDPVIVGILVTAMDEIDLADLLDRDATHAQQVDIVTDALMTVRNEVTVVLVGTAVDMLLDAVLWDDLDVMINEVFDLISDILAGIQI